MQCRSSLGKPQLILLFAIVLGVSLAQCREKLVQPELRQFESVGLNIFVPATVTGNNGRPTTTDFIVDTGSSRTTIDISIANLLDLKPHAVSNNITPGGKTARYTALVSRVSALSQSSVDMEVLVDDLSLFSNGYKRPVGGLLAMDFLKDYMLVIDIPHSRIGLLSGNQRPRGFGRFLRIKLGSENGLLLMPITLPTGATGRVIFDTGFDSPADALLFKSEFGELPFDRQIDSHEIKDTNGSYSVSFGLIQWLGIGASRLKPSLVGISDKVPPKAIAAASRSLMGLFAFRSGVVVLDAPHHTLMVSDPLRNKLDF
jgi:hypothetical protein